jgi:iron complex outermembrane receptor protein
MSHTQPSRGLSRELKFALLATAALVGQNISAPAMAQDKTDSATQSSGLEEIVVTARRREERAQSIPLAITAFSQSDVEQKHIEQVKDLIRVVPSLSVTRLASDPNGPSTGQVRLRGLAGSVTYFADVPVGSTDYNILTQLSHGSGAGFYYDLDNVEAIKGPQGTLFGKNSIGGLISISPKKPSNDYEGYFQATFGNYSNREFEGAVNIPVIADKLMVRIAGDTRTRDGYTKDLSDGKDLDNIDHSAWRVGVTLRPTDDVENYFLYDGYYQHQNGSSLIPTFVNPNFTAALIPLPGIGNVPLTLGNGPSLAALENPATATATYLQLLKTFEAGGKPSVSFFPNIEQILAQAKAVGVRASLGSSLPLLSKNYDYGFTDTFRWDLSDDLTIKNVAAARVFKNLTSENYWGAPLPLLSVGNPLNPVGQQDNTAQYTEELQLQGKALQDKLTWVLGGYLELDHPLGDNDDPTTALGSTSYIHIHEVDRSQALFAHGIYDLGDYVDGLRFTAGYRYTWDYQSIGEVGVQNVDQVQRGTNGVGTNCTIVNYDKNCFVGSDGHFSSYGWNLSVDEQLDPQTLIYVRAGNAYRPGGTNPQVPVQYQSLKPEHVTDVEIGIKKDWDLAAAHFRTNADVYHTDYKSIQIPQNISVQNAQGNVSSQSIYTNAANAFLEGAELEQTIIPIQSVELSAHASYIYTHFNQYPGVVGDHTPPFGFVPKWEYGVTGTYHLPLDQSVGDVAVQMSYSFEGHQYVATQPTGEIYSYLPSYDELDARIDWKDVYGYPVDASFFMTNVTDNTHPTGAIAIYASLGFTSLAYNEPRMYGFSLKYRFENAKAPEEAPTAYVPPPVQAPAAAVPHSYLVFFDFNKSDLSQTALQIVDQAAQSAAPERATRLTVTGHTDTVGSDAYNMRLSRRRAEAVAARLEHDGIGSSEIEIIAKGKRDLLVPTADGVREPQNRRVQIVYSEPSA